MELNVVRPNGRPQLRYMHIAHYIMRYIKKNGLIERVDIGSFQGDTLM